MPAAKNKTVGTDASVTAFIAAVNDARKQADCQALVQLIEAETGFAARMWGSAIIGFGSYHYVYDSGREGDAPLVGFSPRKNELALYIANFEGKEALLQQLGKHKTAKACVYIKTLQDVDTAVLKKLVASSVRHYQEKYG